MRRLLTLLLLFFLFLACRQLLCAQEPHPPSLGDAKATSNDGPQNSKLLTEPEAVGEGDVVRVNTTLVTVPVRVVDRKGKYTSNLNKEDFHLYEDGVEQQISYFASAEEPITVMLLLDTSGSTQHMLKDIQKAALAFVRCLRPVDRVVIVSFNQEIQVLNEPTGARSKLEEAILSTQSGDTTRLYDAVDLAINSQSEHLPSRRAVVLFTDGEDTASRQASYASNMHDAELSTTMIYTIMYSLTAPYFGPKHSLPITYLRGLARTTGARFYRAGDMGDVKKVFSRIAAELRQQYSLGYYPKTPAQSGQKCLIKVKVNQPNMLVRARDSYIYSQMGSMMGQKNREK